MKFSLVFMAIVAVCAGLSIPMMKEELSGVKFADKDFLMKQKFIFDVLYHLHMPMEDEYMKDYTGFVEGKEFYLDYDKVVPFFMMYKYGLLPRDYVFSVFNYRHSTELKGLFYLFYYSKDWPTFYHNVLWARHNVNEGMFVYALYAAVIHRKDMQGIILPAHYEVLPYMYFNGLTIDEILKYKTIGLSKLDSDVVILSKYTDEINMMNDENKLAYFTEDIGWNMYYFFFNLDYPYWLGGKDFGLYKDRRGEQYMYMHQQLLARYYLERLSNKMGEIPEFSWYTSIKTGYNPHLRYYNGLPFTVRKNYYETFSTGDFYPVNRMEDFEHRIRDVIDLGYFVDYKGSKIDLWTMEGIDMLGNLIQSNPDSLNEHYFGKLIVFAHKMLGGGQFNEIFDYKIVPGAMEHYETMLRDPVFYQFYKKIVRFWFQYKSNVPSYKYDELFFSGVKINKVEISKLVTYFDYFDIDVSTMMEVDKMGKGYDKKMFMKNYMGMDYMKKDYMGMDYMNKDYLKSGMYDKDYFMKSGMYDKDYFLKSGTYDKDYFLKSGIYDKDYLMKPGFYDKDNMMKTGFYDKDYFLKSGIYDKDYFSKSGIYDKDYLMKPGMYDKDYYLKSGIYDKDYFLKSGIYDKDYLMKSGMYDKDYFLKSGTYDKDYFLKSGSYDKDYYLKSGIYDKDYLMKPGMYDKDYFLKSGTYDKDYFSKSGIYDKDYLMKSDMYDKDYFLKSGTYDKDYFLKSGIYDKDYLMKSGMYDKDYFLKSGIYDKDYLMKSGMYDKDYLMKTGTYDKDYLMDYDKMMMNKDYLYGDKSYYTKMPFFFDKYTKDKDYLMDDTMLYDKKFLGDYKFKVRQWRLNHKPFTFNLEVASDKMQKVIFRVFMGPKFDYMGRSININKNRENFVEIDQFVYDLKMGANMIRRESRDFYFSVKDRTMYSDLYKMVMLGLEGKKFPLDMSEAHCGFPDRLLLPKGWVSGMPMQFYFIVTPFKDVRTYSTYKHWFSCGIGSGTRFIDDLPFGYPFDRFIDESYFFTPNMYFKDAMIYHLDDMHKYSDVTMMDNMDMYKWKDLMTDKYTDTSMYYKYPWMKDSMYTHGSMDSGMFYKYPWMKDSMYKTGSMESMYNYPSVMFKSLFYKK